MDARRWDGPVAKRHARWSSPEPRRNRHGGLGCGLRPSVYPDSDGFSRAARCTAAQGAGPCAVPAASSGW